MHVMYVGYIFLNKENPFFLRLIQLFILFRKFYM